MRLHPFQGLAMRYVCAATKNGTLPRLDGSIKCVDCGDVAKHYEHRDYTLPLVVDPVCPGCNAKRGPAKNSGFEDRVAEKIARWAAIADANKEADRIKNERRTAARVESVLAEAKVVPINKSAEHIRFQNWLRSCGYTEFPMYGSVYMDGMHNTAWAGWIAALTAARGE